MINLRPHQTEAIDFALSALDQSTARCLAQLPTGSGKSLVKLFVAREWLKMGRPVVMLTPSNLTLSKLYADARTLGMDVSLDWAQHYSRREDPFVIGTYQTAWNRSHKHRNHGALLILDEAHHINVKADSNMDLYHSFGHVFGVSASPWSQHCQELFPAKYLYPLSRAIKEGFVCDYEILPYEPILPGKYQIVYCPSSDDVRYTSRSMSHSDWVLCTRDDAIAVLAKFRAGAIGTMVVNRKLTEGFDLPAVKKVWITRESLSPILVYQMLGRALRPYQGQTAKCYILWPKTRRSLETALHLAG